jgi:hypothetical protein
MKPICGGYQLTFGMKKPVGCHLKTDCWGLKSNDEPSNPNEEGWF